MKKLSFVLAFFFACIIANAQSTSFRPFKFDFAFGYAVPGGSGAKGGVIAALEPKYLVNDNIAVGLRFEAAVMARAYKDPSTGDVTSASVKASGSYLVTGDYLFTTNSFRPFLGVGAGIFSTAAASADVNGNTTVAAGAHKFGFAPRAGFEAGHFRAAVEYNVVGNTAGIDNNYLGVKIGFFIGGGRIAHEK